MKIDQKLSTPLEVQEKLKGFGAALKSVRLKKRLTHEQVADVCNFSRQTLSRIENGDPSVAIGQIARYANAIGAVKALHFKPSIPVGATQKRVRRTAAEFNLAKSSSFSYCTSE
jgi:transcriptional regulator with XRE-family HTH domain